MSWTRKKAAKENATSYRQRERGKTRFDRRQDGYVYFVPFSISGISIIWFVVWLVLSKTVFLHILLTHSLAHAPTRLFVRSLARIAIRPQNRFVLFSLGNPFSIAFRLQNDCWRYTYIMWTVWGAVHEYGRLINFGGLLSNVWFRSIRICSTWYKTWHWHFPLWDFWGLISQ